MPEFLTIKHALDEFRALILMWKVENMDFKWLPWSVFDEDQTHFWIHYGLVIVGFLVAVITLIVQSLHPAPYGKFEDETRDWGCMIPQRFGHMFSDAVPGVLLFLLVFFLYGEQRDYANITFVCLFEIHYIQRGIIHPFIMNYKNPKVPLGITLGGFFPNALFHYLQADWVGSAAFSYNYFYDPRFIIGILLFVTGYIINRWADWKLRNLRKDNALMSSGSSVAENRYTIPYGGLFESITCPNYFGELVEWFGWAICTWSLAGLVWFLFSAATFIPRSKHTHSWYRDKFEEYPPKRKALIPFIF